MKKDYLVPFALFFLFLGCKQIDKSAISISVSFAENLSETPKDGRILLMLSNDFEKEPRFQINPGLKGQIIFGMDVENMSPGDEIIFDEKVFGFPYESLVDVPPGAYNVQALLHTYETFDLATGHTVKLPMDNGEGQQWNRSPGNLYSKPFKINLTEKGIETISVVMDQEIPPIEEPKDTEWIKHIKIKSEKLSEFWGRDMYLGAHILLPKGFDEHLEAKYPLMIFHGHFPDDFGGFRTTPPDPELEPDYSARFNVCLLYTSDAADD